MYPAITNNRNFEKSNNQILDSTLDKGLHLLFHGLLSCIDKHCFLNDLDIEKKDKEGQTSKTKGKVIIEIKSSDKMSNSKTFTLPENNRNIKSKRK